MENITYDGNTLKLDQTTLNFVRHTLAGKVKNARSGAKLMQLGKTELSTGDKIIDILIRDLEEISKFLQEIEEK